MAEGAKAEVVARMVVRAAMDFMVMICYVYVIYIGYSNTNSKRVSGGGGGWHVQARHTQRRW